MTTARIEATDEAVFIDGALVTDVAATISDILTKGVELWTTTHRETVTALFHRGLQVRGIRDLTAARQVCGHVGDEARLRCRPEFDWAITESRFTDLWLHKEFAGIKVDTDWAERRTTALTNRLAELNTQWGQDLTTATAQQLGVASVRLDDLRKLPGTALTNALIEAREAKADVVKLREVMGHVANGRVHPRVEVRGANTGRMTVSAPALHGLRASLRPMLMAEPGHELMGMDWSGCEIRVAAWLADDPVLKQDLEGDLYQLTADRLGITRNAAKVTVLAPLYGQTNWGLAKSLGVSEAEAANIREQVFGRYKKLNKWVAMVTSEEDPFIDMHSKVGGRHIPIPSPTRLRVNYLVQGTARDVLVKATMRAVDDPLLGVGSIFMSVHDELTLMVPTERANEAAERFRTAMTFDLDGVLLTGEVARMGTNWGHP